MHTLSPGMLFRGGQPWVAHGSMGGEIQPQIFAQVVSALVDGGVDVAMAVAAPRWAADVPEHHGPPSLTVVETRYHAAVVEGLRARGHDVVQRGDFDHGIGHAQAIEIVRDPAETAKESSRPTDAGPPDGTSGAPIAFAAATDPRSDGAPAVW